MRDGDSFLCHDESLKQNIKEKYLKKYLNFLRDKINQWINNKNHLTFGRYDSNISPSSKSKSYENVSPHSFPSSIEETSSLKCFRLDKSKSFAKILPSLVILNLCFLLINPLLTTAPYTVRIPKIYRT